MKEKGRNTRQEIFSQTEAWAEALKEVDQLKSKIMNINFDKYNQIIFAGCGSTYYLSIFGARIFQLLTGVICKAIPSGELMMQPDAYYKDKSNLLFVISRSGSTSESVIAAEQFKKSNAGEIICVTNSSNQPLSALGDISLSIEKGQELSVAQTRSFSSMLVAINAIALMAARNFDDLEKMYKLPAIGERIINKHQGFFREIGEDLDINRIYFLGSGPKYGIACEANLKMKEMTLTHTEPFHFLEFRHGPKSMVNKNTLVIGLVSDQKRVFEEKVMKEVVEIGGRTISLAENDTDISFKSNLPESVNNILYLPLLQVMALYRSLKKGLDPDNPKHLDKVVKL